MISSILAIISKVLSLFMWWKKKQDSPVTQIQNERQQFQQAVVSGNETDVNAILNSELQHIQDKDATGSNSK